MARDVMIISFQLSKILYLYKIGKLDASVVNPDAECFADRWIAFMIELIKNRHVSNTRIEFSFIDRTQAVPSIVNTHISADQIIPTGLPISLDYLDICLARANELLATNKYINVLWSGGLDSTVAFFSLLNQCKHIDQIGIICTFESIIESGRMFDSIIKHTGVRVKFDQTRCERPLSYSHDHEDLDQLYVTGHCGDQLFGPAKSLHRDGIQPNDHWECAFAPAILDVIEPSLRFSPRPIETVRDLRWWFFFNHTWMTVLYDDHAERPAHICKRIVPFYAAPEFQRWSMHTPSFYDHTEKYRWQAKQALSRLIDYQYYINNKHKAFSNTWLPNKDWYMLDKNFTNYYVTR